MPYSGEYQLKEDNDIYLLLFSQKQEQQVS